MRIVQAYGVWEMRVRVEDDVKRRMEKEVEREAGQDVQIGLDPGEGLEEGGRSTKLFEEIHYQGV